MRRGRGSITSSDTTDDPQGYLVSVSDIISGLLFLFIITLMVFAFFLRKTEALKNEEVRTLKNRQKEIQLQRDNLQQKIEQAMRERTVLGGMVNSLSGKENIRTSILQEIEREMKRNGFAISVNYKQGLLRLPEQVLFPSGSAQIQPAGEAMLRVLAQVFSRVLPAYCKTVDRPGAAATRSSKEADIEAILIEGHTDNVPVGPGSIFADNWQLSTTRATNTFKRLTAFQPELDWLRNNDSFAVFSVSGYADQRPVNTNDTESTRQHNRRIDVRFLMTPPKATPEIVQKLGRQLLGEDAR